VLGLASDLTVARVLDLASDSTVARVLGPASASTVARVLGLASDSTVARVLDLASDSTVARVKSLSELQVPVVENLDKLVYESVMAHGIKMSGGWHHQTACGTTHCRGGWEITLAGDAGRALEKAVGPETAARLIHEASTGRMAPDYFCDDATALADIKRCAGVSE
jgi:hypothetical protein